jgi:hypothetical protein
MRPILVGLFALCLTSPAVPQQPTEIGSGTVVGDRFQSTFFKFHYEFPRGWSFLSQDKLKADNDESYRKAVESSLKKNGPDTTTVNGNTTTTHSTKVSTPINLLIAGPKPVVSSESDAIPRVRVWANSRMPMINDAGDHAKVLSMMAEKVLLPATEISLGGHKFVRIDVLHKDGIYHSNLMTVSGDYVVGFDFYASTEKDLQNLTETIKTIGFE